MLKRETKNYFRFIKTRNTPDCTPSASQVRPTPPVTKYYHTLVFQQESSKTKQHERSSYLSGCHQSWWHLAYFASVRYTRRGCCTNPAVRKEAPAEVHHVHHPALCALRGRRECCPVRQPLGYGRPQPRSNTSDIPNITILQLLLGFANYEW